VIRCQVTFEKREEIRGRVMWEGSQRTQERRGIKEVFVWEERNSGWKQWMEIRLSSVYVCDEVEPL
jgi:hypothetical protein